MCCGGCFLHQFWAGWVGSWWKIIDSAWDPDTREGARMHCRDSVLVLEISCYEGLLNNGAVGPVPLEVLEEFQYIDKGVV
ncbi:unnamed protein product [Notodromas monacha]|uniref:Uncharacterized protein n=1 Tax=Notodromas monacha TaxID=399045 RepID=A0A7R9BF43_9CRUS|nr:unnamed protein product [Notodromas monacha]CAG0914233.1 unnamed protein product [Notodromas monacha]